eukprot:m.217451 g.217451  ORF g.217451 m.217451 type:complete len:71 (-) comp54107_c0_seq3:77-289(-)
MRQLQSEMVSEKAAEEATLAQEVTDMTANHTEKLAKQKQQHKAEEDRQAAQLTKEAELRHEAVIQFFFLQ